MVDFTNLLKSVRFCIVVDIKEGNGVDDPVRIVHYIYTKDLEYIGRIDPMEKLARKEKTTDRS